MEWAKDIAFQMVRENSPMLIVGTLALMSVGMLLGWLRKLAAALFDKALQGGEIAAARMMEKPKGVLLMAVFGAVALPACCAGYYYAPWKIKTVPVERIVEKPVPYAVQDETEINRLKGIVGRQQNQNADAQSRIGSLEQSLAAARQAIQIQNRQKQEAERMIGELQTQVAALSPTPREARIAKLREEIEGSLYGHVRLDSYELYKKKVELANLTVPSDDDLKRIVRLQMEINALKSANTHDGETWRRECLKLEHARIERAFPECPDCRVALRNQEIARKQEEIESLRGTPMPPKPAIAKFRVKGSGW